METKNLLLALTHKEHYTIPESDYGKAEIYYIHGYYFIFSIPMYGGEPVFEEVVRDYWNKEKQVDKVLEIVNSWT